MNTFELSGLLLRTEERESARASTYTVLHVRDEANVTVRLVTFEPEVPEVGSRVLCRGRIGTRSGFALLILEKLTLLSGGYMPHRDESPQDIDEALPFEI